VLVGNGGQLASQELETQVRVALTAEEQLAAMRLAAQKDHDRDHAIGLEQFAEVQAVMRQAVDGEAARVSLRLD